MIDSIKGKRLWVERESWSPNISFVLFERMGNRVAHSTHIEMLVPKDEDVGKVIYPTFSLSYEESQDLIDQLWQLGLRPSEGTGSAGALAATQRHLEDMRKLVFEFFGKKTE